MNYKRKTLYPFHGGVVVQGWKSEGNLLEWFSFTTSVPGMELRSPGLATSTLPTELFCQPTMVFVIIVKYKMTVVEILKSIF